MLALDLEQLQRCDYSTRVHRLGVLTLPIDIDQLSYQTASVADNEKELDLKIFNRAIVQHEQ